MHENKVCHVKLENESIPWLNIAVRIWRIKDRTRESCGSRAVDVIREKGIVVTIEATDRSVANDEVGCN